MAYDLGNVTVQIANRVKEITISRVVLHFSAVSGFTIFLSQVSLIHLLNGCSSKSQTLRRLFTFIAFSFLLSRVAFMVSRRKSLLCFCSARRLIVDSRQKSPLLTAFILACSFLLTQYLTSSLNMLFTNYFSALIIFFRKKNQAR